jgi:imidazolonepropionase-like amidohydrolase
MSIGRPMLFAALVATPVLSAVAPAPLPAQAQALVFRDARVFTGDEVLEETDVLVSGGRIAAIGRDLSAPAAEVIDARGRTLLPGLIDAHTHTFGDALKEALVFGVTTSLDMFTDVGMARSYRAAQQAGTAADRADLFSAGTLVTAPGGHGTEYGVPIPTIERPDEAQAFVDARIAEGSDWIKIVYDDGSAFGINWPTLDEPTLRAVIVAAHNRDKLALVHVSRAADARTALEAGADGLVHLFVDRAAGSGTAQLAKERGAFIVPTLVVLRSITGTGGGAPLLEDERLLPYITPASRLLLRQAFPARTGANAPRYEHAVEAVRALHAASVPVLAGTDAPNPGTAHGVALHRELELLVEAGLSPVEALRAATAEPARIFGLDDRGSIAEGRRADLVLVDGDPTTDITATRAIAGVWKEGVRADRSAYARAVAAAVAAQSTPSQGLTDGLISDFESGGAVAAFGTPWSVTTDGMAGGTSTGTMAVVDGGANGSAKSLRITGTVTDAVQYGWAGAMWSPGFAPMQPADLSSKKEIVFSALGEGATYRVLVFAESTGMQPLMHEFTAGPEWKEIVVPWTALGTDGRGVMAIMILGGPEPGAFAVQVDDVRLR